MIQWKEIAGTDGKYMINIKGEVLSVRKNIILKNVLASTKYYVVGVTINGRKKLCSIHRLIAENFLPNPLNLPNIHHINHDRSDYRIENLMWVTQSENKKFDYIDGIQKGKTNMKGKFGSMNPGSKKVLMMDFSGRVIDTITGLSEAARIVNGSASHIMKVCKGKLKSHKGYRWAYAESA